MRILWIEKWEGWGQSLLLWWETFYRVSPHCVVTVVRLSSLVFTYSPHWPHKEAALSSDQTRLLSRTNLGFCLRTQRLSSGSELCIKGWLSPKLCDFCVTLIQWLVLLWHSGWLSRPKWHGKMILPLKSLQNVNAWNAKYDNNVNAQVSVQFNLLRTSQLCMRQHTYLDSV